MGFSCGPRLRVSVDVFPGPWLLKGKNTGWNSERAGQVPTGAGGLAGNERVLGLLQGIREWPLPTRPGGHCQVKGVPK